MDQKPSSPGQRLKEIREGWKPKKLSMAKMAAMAVPPTTNSTINKLEKGETELTVEWAKRLAAGLPGVCWMDFFGVMPKLPPSKSSLVQIYRKLDQDDRETLDKVVATFAHKTER